MSATLLCFFSSPSHIREARTERILQKVEKQWCNAEPVASALFEWSRESGFVLTRQSYTDFLKTFCDRHAMPGYDAVWTCYNRLVERQERREQEYGA